MSTQETEGNDIVRKAGHAARRAASRASEIIEEGEDRFAQATEAATTWVAENPRTAIGVLLGSGIFVGMLASSRFGRALLFGLSGIVATAAKRYV
jgi:ElaB/YqjD/DUF883 family membrane-anchored ribosome-binding protein